MSRGMMDGWVEFIGGLILVGGWMVDGQVDR